MKWVKYLQRGRSCKDTRFTSYSPSKKLFLSSALQDSHCRRALFWLPACSSFSADPCPLATLDIPPEGPATGPDWPTIPWEEEPFSAPVQNRGWYPEIHQSGKKKTQSKNRREICFGMIKMFCSSLWFHFGGQRVGITSCA